MIVKTFLNRVFLFWLLMSSTVFIFSQNDTINKFDENGMQHGYWIIYENNVKSEEGRFEHGLKVGTWIGYYPSGKIKHQITYQNGKPNGYAKFYYENGNVSEEGLWKENKWVGEYKFYHKNGNLAYDWNYSESGKRTGTQKYYHENGKIMIEGEWKEGKENGIIKEYDNTGKLIAEKTFNNGQLDTNSIKIFKPTTDSKPDTNKEQHNQQLVEEVKEPQNTNIELFEGSGFHKTYKNGRLDREGEWKNGRLINGKKYFYDENGKLIKTTIYKNGNIVNIIYNN